METMSQYPFAHLFETEESPLPKIPELGSSFGFSSTQNSRPLASESLDQGILSDAFFGQKPQLHHVATGAFVDFGRLLTGAAGRFIPGDDIFESWSADLRRLQNENPHWRPQHVESAWDLLTSPSKLAETVISQSPYLAANMGMMLAGFATGGPVGAALGIAGPFALSFAVEGQSAFEEAIEYGATESEAHFAGNVTGAISGMLELMQVGGLVRFGRGVKNKLVRNAAQRAMQAAEGLFASGLAKPTMELAKEMATQSVQEMLQGTTHEVVAFQVYGKKIDEGFIDRRLQEAIGASATSVLFGAGMRGYQQVAGGKPVIDAVMKNPETASESYDAYRFAADLKNKYGYNEEQVSSVMAITEARAMTWAQETGMDPSTWYAQHLAGVLNNVEPGDVLFQDAAGVGGMFLKSERLIREGMQEKLTAVQALKFLQKNKVSKEEMVWTGVMDFLNERMESQESFSKQDLLKAIEEADFNLRRDVLTPLTEEQVLQRDELSSMANKSVKDAQDASVVLRHNLLSSGVLDFNQFTSLDQAFRDMDNPSFNTVLQSLEGKLTEDQQKQVLDTRQRYQQSKNIVDQYHKFTDKLFDTTAWWGSYASQRTGGENYREILIRLPSTDIVERAQLREAKEARGSRGEVSESRLAAEGRRKKVPKTHWGNDYSVVSIRTTSRVDKKSGNDVLFVEEIQSDWSQKYRARMAALKQVDAGDPNMTEMEANDIQRAGSYVKPPFLNTHRELAIKHLIQFAVQEGYQQVSFQRGDISAEVNFRDDTSGRELSYDVLLPKAIDNVLESLGLSKDLRQTAVHDYNISSTQNDVLMRPDHATLEHVQRQVETDGINRQAEFITLNITPEVARKVSEGMSLFQQGTNTRSRPLDQEHLKYFDEKLIQNIAEENSASRSTLVYMTPQEFLAVAETGQAQEKTDRVQGMIERGEKFGPLHLKFDHDGKGNAVVIGHEGRHRARAMLERGVQSIPVEMRSTEGGKGRSIRWGEQSDKQRAVEGEWPKTLRQQADGDGVIDFPVPDLRLEENQRQDNLFQEGNANPFAGPRAAVQFLKDGRAVMSALQNPDITSALHELAHIFRRDLYSLANNPSGKVSPQIKKDVETLEKVFGIKNGEWSVKQEEALASAWERWLAEGQAPSQGLLGVFEKLKTWFKGVYATASNSPLGLKLNKNLSPVFERLLSPDSVEVQNKRIEVEAAAQVLRKARSERLGLKPSNEDIAKKAYEAWEELGRPVGQDHEIWTYAEGVLNEQAGVPLKEANATMKRLLGELRDLQETQKLPDDRPLLARGDEAVIDFLKTESIETRHRRGLLGRAVDKISVLGSMAAPLRRTKAGRMLVDTLNTMQTEVQTMMGQFAEPIARAVGQLNKSDWNWLYQDPGQQGLPNFVRMVDQTGVPGDLAVNPPNERLAYLRQTMADIQDATGRSAEEVGVMQRLQDGSLQPFRRPKYLKLPRIPTDDMWQALSAKSGPMYDALKREVMRLNPEIKSLGHKDELLLGPSGELTVRRSRALEQSRAIKVMPYYVYVNGKAVEIFRTNPMDMMSKAVEFQARRIAWVKHLGLAGNIKPLSLNVVRKFAKLMKIQMPKLTQADLFERLEKAGIAPEKMMGMNMKELVRLAKDENVPTGRGIEDYVQKLKLLNPNKFNERQHGLVQKLGKALEGVDLRQETFPLLQDIIKRLQEPVQDLPAMLRDKHVAEAGYEGAGGMFDDVLTVWQGLPYHWFKRTTSTRMLRVMSNLIGSAQTSLSVAPNIPQTLALVPGFVGMGRYLQAISNTMKDPYMTRSQVAGMGAFPLAVNSWALEKGYFVEGLGRNVRQFMGEMTGLRSVTELNNTIAGEAGRLMVESWKNHGVTSHDIQIAKRLGLGRVEIAQLEKGEVSEQVQKQVVQRMVAQTQFMTEAPHLKGRVENIPLLRIMFAYANYTLGQTRAMVDLGRHWKDVVGKIAKGQGSWREGFGVLQATTLNLVGMAGAGVAGMVLRQALKGQLTGGDEEPMEDRLVGGLVEVQFLGAAQRMMEPMQHSSGVFEKAMVGTMPHLKAISDGMAALLQMDKYADFDTGERVLAAGKRNFPLFSTLTGRRPTEIDWLENFAYPQMQEYHQARMAGWGWIDKQPVVSRYAREGIKERKGAGYSPINPDFDRVYQWVIRGERLEAKEAVRDLVRKVQEERGDVTKVLGSLRRSLMSRAPIPMNPIEERKFLRSLPEDKRKALRQAERQFVRLVSQTVPQF
jgi:hypothetical protein